MQSGQSTASSSCSEGFWSKMICEAKCSRSILMNAKRRAQGGEWLLGVGCGLQEQNVNADSDAYVLLPCLGRVCSACRAGRQRKQGRKLEPG